MYPLCCSCKSHTESSLFNCLQEKVTNKDIFCFLFPGGYQNVESVSDELGLTPPVDKSFVVVCDKCGWVTYSSSRTNYTGPGVHARSCYDEDWLKNTIREGRAVYHRKGKITKKFQEGLKSSFAIASKQDQDLFTALDLIIHHNIPIHKFKNLESLVILIGNRTVLLATRLLWTQWLSCSSLSMTKLRKR